jgi:hypothetical protein
MKGRITMARNYEVILDKPTTGYIYSDDYFPRGFHYFSDANDLNKGWG